MDTQRKKGVLEVCVLSVLKRGPSYGYQIIQDVSDCIEVTDSTMYPILRRLESGGYVTTYSMEHNEPENISRSQIRECRRYRISWMNGMR